MLRKILMFLHGMGLCAMFPEPAKLFWKQCLFPQPDPARLRKSATNLEETLGWFELILRLFWADCEYWIRTSLFSNEFLLSMMKILWKQEFCELGLDIWGAWLSNIVIENIISDIVEIQYFSIFPFPEKSWKSPFSERFGSKTTFLFSTAPQAVREFVFLAGN